MRAVQHIYSKLPASWQHPLTAALARAELLPRVPLARMFLRTVCYCGGDPTEIAAALREAPPGHPSATATWQRAAARAAACAAPSDPTAARAAYLRAALYASIANWGVRDARARAENQALVCRYFVASAALADPPVEHLWLQTDVGPIAALYRTPARPRGAVLLCHGFDQTKEWMTAFESAAHSCGLATLSIDLPGMGESGVAGTRLRNHELLGPVCRAALDALSARAPYPLFTFGVSGGGLAALSAAAFDPRVAASCGVGSPYSLARILRGLPAQQREHYLGWSGSTSLGELRALIDGFQLAPALARVNVPCLIVHGTRDEVVPFSDARSFARGMPGPSELRAERGDDHMCTSALERGAALEWFAWLACHAASSGSQHGGS
ncbi:MAG TPA: alpha/beta hydrolase [Polyangiales bacterium]|nr:alpha/beta hydrolase [Polyangiales bacterium]